MGVSSSSSASTPAETKKYERLENFFSVVCDGNIDGNITRDRFVRYFTGPVGQSLASKLYDVMSSDSSSPISRQICGKLLNNVLFSSSQSSQRLFYLMMYGTKAKILQQGDCLELLKAAYHLHCQYLNIKFVETPAEDDIVLNTLTESMLSESNDVESSDRWIDTNCPELFCGMHSWLVMQITKGKETDNIPATVLQVGNISDGSCSTIMNGVMWWLLSSSLPSSTYYQLTTVQRPQKPSPNSTQVDNSESDKKFWTILYDSQEHGLSINRFQHHIFAYRGPTILLVSYEDGYRYAVAVDTEWREGTIPWGGQNCYLFQLSPKYKMIEEGDKMILFNDKSRNIPKGLFIGRDKTRYSLKITDSMESGEYCGKTGQVLDLEVWGCGGTGAKAHQVQQKKREQHDTQKNAQVKLPGTWDENPDKMLLEWGGIRPSYGDQFKMDLGPDSKS